MMYVCYYNFKDNGKLMDYVLGNFVYFVQKVQGKNEKT